MLKKIKSTVAFLKGKTSIEPQIGLVLGSGLGNLVDQVNNATVIPYQDIPNFPVSTVEGHAGNLVFGTIHDVPVVMMQGRFHYYEGYDMQDVVFPIRVMKLLGIDTLVITNAAGGLNPDHAVGDLMLINDHINLFGTNPLIGTNIQELGPRFPDMHETFSKAYIELAKTITCEIPVHEGVYVGVSGPTFETPAEYKYMRIIGGDAVGMSTVPEAIVAAHMGLSILGVSVITDLGVEGKIGSVSHQEVQEAAAKSSIYLSQFIQDFIHKQSLTLR